MDRRFTDRIVGSAEEGRPDSIKSSDVSLLAFVFDDHDIFANKGRPIYQVAEQLQNQTLSIFNLTQRSDYLLSIEMEY